MNETFKVRTLFDCEDIANYKESNELDTVWIQTMYGCKVLEVLRDIYRFNMTYIIPKTQFLTEDERGLSVYPQLNETFDIYVKPIGLTNHALDNGYPIGAICTWRYGFILKRPYTRVLRQFYSLPFTNRVWNSVYLMILLASCIFFYLSRWERRITNGYSCYHYELLLAIGACCQHILPLQANIYSRRIAYLSFILFTYVLHSFYTSNLLSHLVSDDDNSMDLQMLAESDYRYAKLDNLFIPTEQYIYKLKNISEKKPDLMLKSFSPSQPLMMHHGTNLGVMQNELSKAEYVNLDDGLRKILTTRTALLSDYVVVYPVLIKRFDWDVICQLIEIDLYADIKKYIYTSKAFPYKEEFKIGILRVKETGLLRRLLASKLTPLLNCVHGYQMSAEFEQIVTPCSVLLGCYLVATIIMICERWHYERFKVWPYTE